MGKFTFGKIQCNKFKYTGLNNGLKEDGTILIDQNNYIQNLQPIISDKSADKSVKLSKKMCSRTIEH